MVLPEFILVCCTFTGFGRPLGLRAEERKVDVTETNFPCCDIFFLDLTPRVSCESRTERSLKIAKFDQRNGGFRVAFEMAYLGNDRFHERFAVVCARLLLRRLSLFRRGV